MQRPDRFHLHSSQKVVTLHTCRRSPLMHSDSDPTCLLRAGRGPEGIIGAGDLLPKIKIDFQLGQLRSSIELI